YELIWKRTAASQMADAKIEKTTVEISLSNPSATSTKGGAVKHLFIANGEVITFDGFLKVYRESTDDEENGMEEFSHILPDLKQGDVLQRKEISAIERFSSGPIRYTEASLVHKLEELGIGRPSTYAPTISTIQQREYVQKGDKKGEERSFSIDTLKGDKVVSKCKKEIVGNEKGKLLPTDIGIVVNDFLMQNFPNILDYHFTANIEEEFDSIAAGKSEWNNVIRGFYKHFEPEVENVINARSEHKAGERQLGVDPKTGRPVYAKIGRFGPVIQIGDADDNQKPEFAQIPSDKSMETITLEEAMDLFKLPRTVGLYEGTPVVIGKGKFGPYVMHDHKYVSLPKTEDPMSVTLETAISLITEKRQQDKERHLKAFEENPKMEILNGRYGPYIVCDGKNYRIPKALHSKVKELTYQECMEIMEKTKK
ncbi:MAG: DNA topoisomerase I, partial [Prevotella sp.]|nr:DNA topoisomerase I [Prevotella sp.]